MQKFTIMLFIFYKFACDFTTHLLTPLQRRGKTEQMKGDNRQLGTSENDMPQHRRPALLDVAVGTALGAGFWPWGPGTAGAAVATIVWCCYALPIANYGLVMGITALLTLLVTLLSIAPINRLEKFWGPDPSRVVVDEVVGVWITLLAVPETREWYYILAAFILFRLMDILKPLGCRWLDRNVHGGWGVMLDDILAGVYGAGILLWITTLI